MGGISIRKRSTQNAIWRELALPIGRMLKHGATNYLIIVIPDRTTIEALNMNLNYW